MEDDIVTQFINYMSTYFDQATFSSFVEACDEDSSLLFVWCAKSSNIKVMNSCDIVILYDTLARLFCPPILIHLKIDENKNKLKLGFRYREMSSSWMWT